MTLAGGCACGAVRYECTTAPFAAFNCHCCDCQRETGSAYAAIIRVGSLDDPSGFRPSSDIFASRAQPWDHMDPTLPKHPQLPD